MMQIDMSPEAVTNRMIGLDQLWELAMALKSSRIVDRQTRRLDVRDNINKDSEEIPTQEPTLQSIIK